MTFGVLIELWLTRPPKVANLDHIVIVNEEVFRLKITMDEAIFVQEVNTGHRLDEVVEGLLLREAILLLDEHE